jgi:protein-disulfide isomerase
MRASQRAADGLRIRATPTFLIGDQRIEGALPLQRFREVLEAAYVRATTPAG